MDFLDRLVLWVHFVYIRRIGFCHRLIFSFFLFLTKTQKQHWSSTTAEMTSYRNEETQYTVKHDERWLKTFSTDCTLRFPWVWTDSNSPYRIRNRKRRKKFRKRYIICCHRFWYVVCHCSLIIAMLMRPYSSFLANLKRISNRFLLLLKNPNFSTGKLNRIPAASLVFHRFPCRVWRSMARHFLRPLQYCVAGVVAEYVSFTPTGGKTSSCVNFVSKIRGAKYYVSRIYQQLTA